MARTIPTTEPEALIAGDSWQWDRTLGDYPAATWTLTYYFSGPSKFSFDAAESGDTYQIRRTAAQTASITPGQYRFVGRVSDGTDTFTVFTGEVYVRPNIATAASSQSHAEQMIPLIEAALKARATGGFVDDFTINGRSVNRMDVTELRRLLGHYRAEVRAQRSPGTSGRRQIGVSFARPS